VVAGLAGSVKVFGGVNSGPTVFMEQDNFIAFDPGYRGPTSVAPVRRPDGIIAVL
jgi:hypothetical protein